jgi:hypothetical protein
MKNLLVDCHAANLAEMSESRKKRRKPVSKNGPPPHIKKNTTIDLCSKKPISLFYRFLFYYHYLYIELIINCSSLRCWRLTNQIYKSFIGIVKKPICLKAVLVTIKNG